MPHQERDLGGNTEVFFLVDIPVDRIIFEAGVVFIPIANMVENTVGVNVEYSSGCPIDNGDLLFFCFFVV